MDRTEPGLMGQASGVPDGLFENFLMEKAEQELVQIEIPPAAEPEAIESFLKEKEKEEAVISRAHERDVTADERRAGKAARRARNTGLRVVAWIAAALVLGGSAAGYLLRDYIPFLQMSPVKALARPMHAGQDYASAWALLDQEADGMDFGTSRIRLQDVTPAEELLFDDRYVYAVSGGRLTVADKDEKAQPVYLSGEGKDVRAVILMDRRLCVFYQRAAGQGQVETGMDIVDMSGEQPVETSEVYAQQGGYVAAFERDGMLFLVTHYDFHCADADAGDPATFVPSYRVNGQEQLVPEDGLYIPSQLYSNSYAVLSFFDFSGGNGTEAALRGVKAVLGGGNDLYAAGGEICFVNDYSTGSKLGGYTQLVRFDISSGRVLYQAAGAFDGSVYAASQGLDGLSAQGVNIAVVSELNHGDVQLTVLDSALRPLDQPLRLGDKSDIGSVRFVDGQCIVETAQGFQTVDVSTGVNLSLTSADTAVDFPVVALPFGENTALGMTEAEENGEWFLDLGIYDVTDPSVPVLHASSRFSGNRIRSAFLDSAGAAVCYEQDGGVWIAVSVSCFDGIDNLDRLVLLSWEGDTLTETASLDCHNASEDLAFVRTAYLDGKVYAMTKERLYVCRGTDLELLFEVALTSES